MEATKNKVYQLARESLPDQVYRILKEMIADRRFEYGSYINVEELSRALKISRTPIWEAVRRLEQEGVVEKTPNKGVRLRQLTREMALELYQVRLVLENLAVECASERITPAIVKEMEEYERKMKDLVELDDLAGTIPYSQLDYRYHMLIAETSGNSLLKEIVSGLRYKALPLAFSLWPYLPEFIAFHKDITDGLRRHDKTAAVEGMLRHNSRMIELVRELPWGADK